MYREQVERCLAADMTVREWCEPNHVDEWIELSSGSTRARIALAVRPGDEAPETDVSAGGWVSTGVAAADALVVRVNGADVVVPEGAGEPHLPWC